MTKFNTIKRKANVGERILITASFIANGTYRAGDVLTIKSVDEFGVYVDDSMSVIRDKEYEVITEASEMVKVKSLKEIVGSLVDCGYTCEAGPLKNNVDFQLLAQIAGYPTGGFVSKHTAVLHKGETVVPAGRTPQQQRDDIIEQAKRDVAELKQSDGYYRVQYAEGHTKICNAEFIVNNEKRTVVALLRGKYTKKVWAKGIAKCAPTDCFNAHIGKAIALRRALGLEVPAEYLNAPQPTEVRDGDIIKRHGRNKTFLVQSRPNMKRVNLDYANGLFMVYDDTRDGASE